MRAPAEAAAVVFDLDDTLYLEREYVRSGARAVAACMAPKLDLDASATEAELLSAVSREPAGDPLGRWLRRRGLAREEWLPAMLDCYRSHQPAIRLETNVERLLNRLAATHALGLVTDGRAQQQRDKVQALRLNRWPIARVLSDEMGREFWKPSVEPYLRALELLGVDPERAVYVGDNPAKDFLGARRAGMRSIRWRRRGGLHFSSEPASPDHAADWETASIRGLERLLFPGTSARPASGSSGAVKESAIREAGA